MDRIMDRLVREPVATRAFVAAVLALLVHVDVIDTALADHVEAVGVTGAALAVVLSARPKVTPEVEVESLRATALEAEGDQRG